MTSRRALAIAVISLAGCDHLLQLDDIKPARDAPSSDTRSPDARPDAPPDAPSELLCLGDDFNQTTINTTVWAMGAYDTPPSSVTDDGTQLAFTLGTSNTSAYSGVQTNYFDFSHMRTVIEVDQVPGQMGATIELAWRNAGTSDRLDIYVDGTTLFFGQMLSTGPDEHTATYDPTAMRWWQIRHDLGAIDVAFDVSPDGITWTNLRTVFTPLSLTSVSVMLQAGTYQSVNSPGNAAFDNFEMIGTCK